MQPRRLPASRIVAGGPHLLIPPPQICLESIMLPLDAFLLLAAERDFYADFLIISAHVPAVY